MRPMPMRRMPQRADVYDADILELSDAQKNVIRMGLAEWARYIDVEVCRSYRKQ